MNDLQALNSGFTLHGEKEYRIESVLGHGGCGILYHATSEVMDGNIPQIHEYAIKEYFDKDYCRRRSDGSVELTNDNEECREIREEFRSEAICLRNLKHHDNIVHVNEVFEDNGTFYYVMEYLNGPTLRQYAKNKLSEAEAVGIVAEVAKAVNYLHSEYINHLDIKPDNIMMARHGESCRPVLIDFGLSKHFKTNGSPKGRQGYDGASDGYSPKEQYEGISCFSPESDVYSLAATLLFLLTGSDPCHGKDMSLRYLSKQLPDNISDATANAMINALNADRSRRTRDISTFYCELTGKQLRGKSGTYTKKVKKKVKSQTDTPDNSKWKVISVIAVMLLLILFVIRFLPTPGQEVSSPDEKKDTTVNVIPDTPVDTINTPEAEEQEKTEDTHLPEPAKPIPVPVPQPPTDGKLDLGYATYTGDIKNGKPDGIGKMRFKRSHRIDSNTMAEAGDVFDGTYTDGHIDAGKLIRSNGDQITIVGEN